MKNLGRTIRIGLVVGILFFGWYLRDIYARNWRFQLFSTDSWTHVWKEFKAGWIISTPYEWSWLLTIIFMLPIFFILWWVSCKISWRKSLKTVLKSPTKLLRKATPEKVIRKKVKLKTKVSHKKVRPPHMTPGGRPAVKQTGRTMDANKAANIQAQPAFQPMANGMTGGFSQMPSFSQDTSSFDEVTSPPFLDDEMNNIALDDIHLPEKIRLEEDLISILSQSNYQVVADAIVNKLKITYVGISADKVVLCLTDVEKGDWLADEEFFNDEEPLWFSESSHRISPVYTLLTTAKAFAKKISEAGLSHDVIPILIEKEGTIINATDMFETWKKMGVIVCRTDLGGPEELQAFGSALPTATDKGTTEILETVRNLF